VPCKDEKGKIKEYRYVRIRAADTQLLDIAQAYRKKCKQTTVKGLEDTVKRLDTMVQGYEFAAEQAGKTEDEIAEIAHREAMLKLDRLIVKDSVTKKSILETVKQLKAAQQITKDYKLNVNGIKYIVEDELCAILAKYKSGKENYPKGWTFSKEIDNTLKNVILADYNNNFMFKKKIKL
jgi:hypothetical protein